MVGDDAERIKIRTQTAQFAEKVFRRSIECGAEQVDLLDRRVDLFQAGDACGAKIDDLHGTRAVDHDVVRLQILVNHFQPVKGLQALGDLFEDGTHGRQIRFGIVDHPLGQRLTLDVLGNDMDALPGPGLGAGFEDVGAADATGNPLFKQETFKSGGVGLHVDGWRLDDDALAAVVVHGKVNMAAGGAFDDPDDLVALELVTCFELWRARQIGNLAENFVGLRVRQLVDADQLNGQVVAAATLQGFINNGLGGCIEIGTIADRRLDKFAVAELINAIGGQNQ